jgi:hypothetical protein
VDGQLLEEKTSAIEHSFAISFHVAKLPIRGRCRQILPDPKPWPATSKNPRF